MYSAEKWNGGWIGLEELDTGEFLLGVFYLPQGKLIGGYNI